MSIPLIKFRLKQSENINTVDLPQRSTPI